MKYLDEYRDGAAARKLAAAIARTVTRPWTIMEVCGGQTHTIVKYGIDQLLPPEVELVHGPGCPVCVTSLEMIDRAHAIASRPGRHLLLVRRHAPRARLARRPARSSSRAGRDVRVVYSPLDAVNLAAAPPRPPGRLLRHRLRDDRAAQRDGRLAGAQAAAGELQRAGLARPGAAGDDRASCEAPDNRVQGFLGPGPRLHRDGHARVRADRPPLPRADRRSPASSRSTCSKASCAPSGSSRRAGPRSRTRTRRAVRPEGNPRVAAADRRRLRGLRPQVARGRPDPQERLPAPRTSIATTTPSGSSRSTTSRPQESPVCISGQILKG